MRGLKGGSLLNWPCHYPAAEFCEPKAEQTSKAMHVLEWVAVCWWYILCGCVSPGTITHQGPQRHRRERGPTEAVAAWKGNGDTQRDGGSEGRGASCRSLTMPGTQVGYILLPVWSQGKNSIGISIWLGKCYVMCAAPQKPATSSKEQMRHRFVRSLGYALSLECSLLLTMSHKGSTNIQFSVSFLIKTQYRKNP